MASIGARITSRHVVQSVCVLDTIDTDVRSSGVYKLDVVLRMGDFYQAIQSLREETIHLEVSTNLFRQRVMLSSIRLLHVVRGWIHTAQDIVKRHFDCMDTSEACHCVRSNQVSHWLCELAVKVSDKLELHSRSSTPWTISSRQHLIDLQPPVVFKWEPVASQKVPRVNAEKFAIYCADVVGRILCTWLDIPVDNEWIASAVLLENISDIIGPGALLMVSTWDAYLLPPGSFTDHSNMTARGFRITAGCFTELCAKLNEAKDEMARNGRLELIKTIHNQYALFLEKLLESTAAAAKVRVTFPAIV